MGNMNTSMNTLGGYSSFNSVFGSGDGNTPSLLDLSEFPSLTNRNSGDVPQPNPMPGAKPYVGMVKQVHDRKTWGRALLLTRCSSPFSRRPSRASSRCPAKTFQRFRAPRTGPRAHRQPAANRTTRLRWTGRQTMRKAPNLDSVCNRVVLFPIRLDPSMQVICLVWSDYCNYNFVVLQFFIG